MIPLFFILAELLTLIHASIPASNVSQDTNDLLLSSRATEERQISLIIDYSPKPGRDVVIRGKLTTAFPRYVSLNWGLFAVRC